MEQCLKMSVDGGVVGKMEKQELDALPVRVVTFERASKTKRNPALVSGTENFAHLHVCTAVARNQLHPERRALDKRHGRHVVARTSAEESS